MRTTALGRAGNWPASLIEPRAAAVVLLVVSAAALGFAFGSQYLGGLAPCPLCIYQRWPYALVIALAGAALVAPWPRALLALGALALAGNAVLAGYHVGVEQGWFALPAGCEAAGIGAASTVEELRALLAAAPPRCDEVAWSFLGLSMAAWNGLLALALALIAALAAGWDRARA